MRMLLVNLFMLQLLPCAAWTIGAGQRRQGLSPLSATATTSLTEDVISKLRFRELHSELEQRQLDTKGTTAQLRSRLKNAEGLSDECVVDEDGMGDDCEGDSPLGGLVSFVDESDPDFERKELLREISDKVEKGHWKAATRKLKRYSRRFGDQPLTAEVLNSVLTICTENRLQGARASEPARKIMEQMVELQYPISEKVGNYCIKNCLGFEGPHSTHEGFGGVDTALAMLSALEHANTPVQLETYDRVCTALAKEGSIDQALTMLRKVVVDLSETPTLSTFATIAYAAATAKPELNSTEKVPTVLALAKAAGYELDNVASIEDGRKLLAASVIASEKMDNIGLGLRLLTAASRASGVEPDRGDALVASSSSAAQRASTLIHKRAINRAVEEKQWKLAVKLLELMLQRSLKPSPWIWRNVVTCCAKAERSRKTVSLLLDWTDRSERKEADKPPLSVFNTVMNVCEICNEQDLTLQVLDAMKKTHDTQGNIITFNIALKRLAKLASTRAIEGMIIGMLKEGVEPTVVSYTTAIAACVSDEANKNPSLAYEWLKRMRSRRVNPNVLTYNTALASCLDGKLESAVLGSRMASEMLGDVEKQLTSDDVEVNDFTNVIPDSSSKFLARRLIEQVDKAVESGEIDARVAEETMKKSLAALAEYVNCDTTECFLEQAAAGQLKEEDEVESTGRDEMELEYQAVSDAHRIAEV